MTKDEISEQGVKELAQVYALLIQIGRRARKEKAPVSGNFGEQTDPGASQAMKAKPSKTDSFYHQPGA